MFRFHSQSCLTYFICIPVCDHSGYPTGLVIISQQSPYLSFQEDLSALHQPRSNRTNAWKICTSLALSLLPLFHKLTKQKGFIPQLVPNIQTLLISIGITLFSRAAQRSVLEGKADSSKIMVPKGTGRKHSPDL